MRAFIPQRLSRSPEYFEFVNNVLNLIICESLKETGGMTSYTACTICTQWSRPTAQAGRSWDYLLIMFQDEYPGDFASLINLIPERKPRIAEDQKKKHVLSWDLFHTLTKMQPWDTFSVWIWNMNMKVVWVRKKKKNPPIIFGQNDRILLSFYYFNS